jgi:hypothetical protein
MSDRAGTIWQLVGTGAGRPYADEMIRHGVMLAGPGDAGPWPSTGYSDNFALRDTLRWFAETAEIGDNVVLRMGRTTIRAVGLIAGPYEYSDRFDDVNGLDRQHYRRVRWFELPSEHDFGQLVFGQRPGAFSRVRSRVVRGFVERLLGSEPSAWQAAALPPLPAEEPPLENVPVRVMALVGQAQDLLTLYGDDGRFGAAPSEDEMVAHFATPLLRELGWPAEFVGVKWRNVDIALFRSLPRSPDTCELVVEVKRLGVGVEGALIQARRYVQSLSLTCDVAVTDGIRWRRYARDLDYAACGYANLARPKARAADLFARLQGPRWSG